MNIQSLIAVLICISLVMSGGVLSEEMPVSPKVKAAKVEADLNFLLKESLKAAAVEMDKDFEMGPFAMIKKSDGTTGFFTPAPDTNKSVDQQVATIRAMLEDLARTKQILAAVQVQYVKVSKNDKVLRQGITFEIEHVEGISMFKFLPVNEVKDENNKITGLNFQTDKLTSSAKEAVVFSKSIVR